MPALCPSCGGSIDPAFHFCPSCGVTSSRPTGPLAPGDTLQDGNYRIERLLKAGGMGCVYLARHWELGVRAIKELYSPDPDTRAQDIALFRSEAQLLEALDHPGIPQVMDYFLERGRFYLVMKFIAGQDLENLIRVHPQGLPVPQVRAWALQVLDTLEYLHSRQPPIIHRDIKPANLILKPSGRLVLVDFGIARRYRGGQKRDTTVLGTPGYAPPEQYGRSQSGPASDLYALGATLHYLLSGQDPAKRANPFAFPPLRRARRGADPSLRRTVERALALDASQRFPDAASMRRSLERPVAKKRWPVVLAMLLGTLTLVHTIAPSEPPATAPALAPPAVPTPAPESTALAPASQASPLAPPAAETPLTTGALEGTVQVETVPAGAQLRLSVGSQEYTATAPYRFTLPVGPVRIEASLDGYQSASTSVNLRGGQAHVAQLELVKAAPAASQYLGSVQLETDPPGAQVSINGQSQGQTPLTLALAPGAYQLRLEHPGYEPAIRPLEIGLNPLSLTVPLVPLPTGTVRLSTIPPGAQVVVDGVVRGTTPLSLELATGEAEFLLERPGYLAARRPITVTPGASQQLELPLERAPFLDRGGPERSGVYPDGPADPAQLLLRWTALVGGALQRAGLAALGDTLYVAGADHYLYALDRTTGQERWRFRTTGDHRAPPAVSSDLVFLGDDSGQLYAVRARSGELAWEFSTGQRIAGSPLLVGGAVLVGSVDNYLYSLVLSRGTERWRYYASFDLRGAPAYLDGQIYIANYYGVLQALEVSLGELLWQRRTDARIESTPALGRLDARGVVVVTTNSGTVAAYDARGGDQLWSLFAGMPLTTPAVYNQMAFLGTHRGQVWALDLATGETEWTFDTGSSVTAAPALSNGVVYAATRQGVLLALRASDGQELWRYQLSAGAYAAPLPTDGWLLVIDENGQVYAFSSADPTP